MKIARVLIIVTVAMLVFGIVFLIFSVHSRLKGTEYQFQVDAVLTAASIASEEDPLTVDPERSVVAEYGGKRTVVVPGNFRALSSYLRKDAASMPFLSADREKALKLTVCGEAVFYIAPKDDTGDVLVIGADLPDARRRRKPLEEPSGMLYEGNLSRRKYSPGLKSAGSSRARRGIHEPAQRKTPGSAIDRSRGFLYLNQTNWQNSTNRMIPAHRKPVISSAAFSAPQV